MSEYAGRSNLPDYVSIKEAARLLGLSDKRVYEYVNDGRLSSVWAANVIMIPLSEVETFKRRSAGRPRKSVPTWRISTGDNTQHITTITVQIRRYDAFIERLDMIRNHRFPGTVARYIAECDEQITIMLVWKGKHDWEQALEAFRQDLADVLDWESARYTHARILMHT